MKVNPEKIGSQYKYCFKCGGKFKWMGEKLLVCTNCKLRFYISPVPVNGAILTNELGEILLIERGIEPKKGLWDLPGGFLDFNEDAEESMLRELKEELNLTNIKIKYFCSVFDFYIYDNIKLPTIGFIFTGKLISEKIKASDDAKSFKFFKPNKLPLDKIGFDGIKNALIKFVKQKE